MARVRGDRQLGAGAVEYIGMVVGVAALVVGLILVFPKTGEQLVCKLQQAVGSLTGGGSAGCSGGGGHDEAGSGGSAPGQTSFITPKTTTTTSGTSTLTFDVDVPEGQNWSVTSDQPWVSVSDGRVFTQPTITGLGDTTHGGGNGPGSVSVVVHANPNADGPPRTASITFTGPNGETYTQTITQSGGTAKTVVLGDSFSAGNGSVKDHPDGKDDGCHRSSMSWGRQIEAGRTTSTGTPSVTLTGFGACSGATVTGTSLSGAGGSRALLDEIADNKDALAQADQVAFSIGGNDINFADIVSACVVPVNSVNNCHKAVVEGGWLINGKGGEPSPLRQRLEEAYRAALEAAPNATVYIVGYPPMVELDDTGGGFLDWGEIEPENRQEVVDLINDLNFQIANAVADVNSSTPGGPRLVFVDPTADGSPFHGHSLTDDDPFYNGLQLDWGWPPVSPQSYHPNDEGNTAYAD